MQAYGAVMKASRTTEIDASGGAVPVLDDNNGERMVPASAGADTFWEHVYRYAFATRFVMRKRVLDIACGEGYGAAALIQAGAAQVIGVDVSEMACAHARNKYGLDARLGNTDNIPLPGGSVDVVVSFETIEHVLEPGRFLDECFRVLAPGGRLVISTPNRKVHTDKLGVRNPHHCSELTEDEFASLLGARFRDLRFNTQRPESVAWWSLRTLACESTPWKRVRGVARLRFAVQRRIFPEGVSEPTGEQRATVSALIRRLAQSRRTLLNRYVVRPRRRFYREESVYIIATAVR
jgi:SAM-dependent methyltransferase